MTANVLYKKRIYLSGLFVILILKPDRVADVLFFQELYMKQNIIAVIWLIISVLILFIFLTCDTGETPSLTEYFRDADEDGYGVAGDSILATGPSGEYTSTICTDCDDTRETVYPGAAEICDDDLDNDCDGYTDCQDNDCTGYTGPGGGQCLPESEACLDGYDNDGDGLIDCDDPDCTGSLECMLSGVEYSEVVCGDSISDTNDFDLGFTDYSSLRWIYPGKESVFLFVPSGDAVVTVELEINTSENLDLFLLEGSLSSDACMDYSDQLGTVTEQIVFAAQEGTVYFFIVDARQVDDEGNFTISITCN